MYDSGEKEGPNLLLQMGSWVDVLGYRVRTHRAPDSME